MEAILNGEKGHFVEYKKVKELLGIPEEYRVVDISFVLNYAVIYLSKQECAINKIETFNREHEELSYLIIEKSKLIGVLEELIGKKFESKKLKVELMLGMREDESAGYFVRSVNFAKENIKYNKWIMVGEYPIDPIRNLLIMKENIERLYFWVSNSNNPIIINDEDFDD